jgi:hypothetical protein
MYLSDIDWFSMMNDSLNIDKEIMQRIKLP